MGILMGIALNPYIALGNIDNFFEYLKIFFIVLIAILFLFFCHAMRHVES